MKNSSVNAHRWNQVVDVEKYPGQGAKISHEGDNMLTFFYFFFLHWAWLSGSLRVFFTAIVIRK